MPFDMGPFVKSLELFRRFCGLFLRLGGSSFRRRRCLMLLVMMMAGMMSHFTISPDRITDGQITSRPAYRSDGQKPHHDC